MCWTIIFLRAVIVFVSKPFSGSSNNQSLDFENNNFVRATFFFDHEKDFLLKTLEYYKEKMYLKLFVNFGYLLLILRVLTNFLSFH